MSATSQWKRGIGNDSHKIWDERERLVATVESSRDGTTIVNRYNTFDQAREALRALTTGEVGSFLKVRFPVTIKRAEAVLAQMEAGEEG